MYDVLIRSSKFWLKDHNEVDKSTEAEYKLRKAIDA